MRHLNGHMLCAVDIETTGLKVGIHDIVQICVMPLDADCKPSLIHYPFDLKITPTRLEDIDISALKINKLKLANLVLTGMDPYIAADLLGEWFAKLGLPEGKRIMPLAHNWVFDSAFIAEWLGFENFQFIFDGRYRDTMCTALFWDDKADVETEQYPFPKVNLSYIAKCLKIPFEADNCHDAVYDCALTAACYREMLRLRVGIL